VPDLDATAKESNLKDSVKRYFIDSLYKTEGVHVTFDKYLSTPRIQGKEVDRWVSINFGSLAMSSMSQFILRIFPCTRSDSEGFKLSQLRDKIYKYLVNADMTDGMARIPFYRSRAEGAWTLLDTGMVVQDVIESDQLDADDGTKFKEMTVRIRFSAKV